MQITTALPTVLRTDAEPTLLLSLEDALTDGNLLNHLPAVGGIVVVLYSYYLYHQRFEDKHLAGAAHVESDFWTSHYQLDKLLRQWSSILLSQLGEQDVPNADLLHLVLIIHIAAMTIQLHENMVAKAKQQSLAHTAISESENRCIAAAGCIAKIASSMQKLDSRQVCASNVVVQANISRPWHCSNSVISWSHRFLVQKMYWIGISKPCPPISITSPERSSFSNRHERACSRMVEDSIFLAFNIID